MQGLHWAGMECKTRGELEVEAALISGTRLKVLRAVVGRVIPRDEFAGGVEAGR